jgi:hypothetical protein
MKNCILCPLKWAYNQLLMLKKGCFPQYGKGEATLQIGIRPAYHPSMPGGRGLSPPGGICPIRLFLGTENDDIGLENTHFWDVNDE